MKETLVSVFQQRMDKCTYEQFWLCAVITGLNGFIVSQRDNIVGVVSLWSIILALLFLVSYGIFYLMHRHISHYKNRDIFLELIKGQNDVLDMLGKPNKPYDFYSFIGTGFYIAWIILCSAFSILYLCLRNNAVSSLSGV